ncbi:MAG: beta-ketoacyl synthase N-terminal-like domain-containing protein, partial [Solirubrobacteraceae bacterium]
MHTIAEPIAPTPEGERATPIAIVGLACRFPDADDPLTLFESALAGRRSFRRLPPGRLGVAADGAQPPRAALLEGWQFSRAEFGVAEAAYQAADPAHWLALETAGRALADAGFPGGQGLAGDLAGVLLSGPDRAALATLLSQVAAAAPGLSDAELSDLACQSGREAGPGPVRVALIATHQDELSRLCRDAASLLPSLRTG